MLRVSVQKTGGFVAVTMRSTGKYGVVRATGSGSLARARAREHGG